VSELVSLGAMPIADKVTRFLQARFYSVQLAALEASAAAIGCAFVQRPDAHEMPSDVEEHLAFAVMLAREACLAANESPQAHYRTAQARLEDGYATALLREITAALEALGLRLQVRPQGFDWEAMRAQRLGWESRAHCWPLASAVHADMAAPVDAAAVDQFVADFFNNRPDNGARA
jgi:hypothetical protein